MAPASARAALASPIGRSDPTRLDPDSAHDVGGRPHVVLVAWRIGPPEQPAGHLARIVERAAERVDFTVVSTEVPPELRPLVRWLRVPARRRAVWGRLTWALFFATAWIRLRGVRADLVHTVGPAPLVPGRVDLASVAYCHSLYHSAVGHWPVRGVRKAWRFAAAAFLAVERACYRRGRVRLLGAECASARRTLERLFPDLDVDVVPTFPIDTSRFRSDDANRAALRREENVGEQDVVAIFVGRYWPLKGLELAIAGLAEASRLGASGLRLWVLGDGDVPRYEALAARAGVADRVRFFGMRSDIERYYQASDVLVLPTLCETFCRAAYEAAATSLPVVATAVDGIVDLVGDSEAGLLVERSGHAVGAALARLAADANLRERMGEEGRRRSLEHTVERSADAFVATYERLLAVPPAGVEPAHAV